MSSCVSVSKQSVKEQFVFTNPQVSLQYSLEFLKKLTVITASSICYLRNIFPEDAFTDKEFDGQSVKVLKRNNNIPGTTTVVDWLKSAFELVSHNYLKKLIFVIQNQKSDTLETYTFQYEYNAEEIKCELLGKTDGPAATLSKATSKLPEDIAVCVRRTLRSILMLTTTMKPLPLYECEFSLRLELDENTPDNIDLPEFFKFVDSYDMNFPDKANNLKLGRVESKFTKFTLSLKSVFNQFDEENEDDEECIQKSQTEPLAATFSNVSVIKSPTETQHLQGSNNTIILSESLSSRFVPMSQIESRPLSPNVSLDKSLSTKLNETQQNNTAPISDNLSVRLSSVSIEEKKISCICECDDDQFDDLIKCTSCSTFQHKACYKLLESHNGDTHICINCHDPTQNKTCSVPDLIDDDKRKGNALYRRALLLALKESHLSTNKIMTYLKVSRQKAGTIYNQLDFDGCFLPSTGKGFGRNIDVDHLKNVVFGRYFTTPKVSKCYKSMEVVSSPVICGSKTNGQSRKRHLDEDKENSPQGTFHAAQMKRKKICE